LPLRVVRCSHGGVQLDGLTDAWCTFRVEPDAVEEPAVLFGPDVEVAELGARDGAAIKRLVPQLLLDVFASLADLEALKTSETVSMASATYALIVLSSK